MRILHVIPQFPYFGGRTIVGGHASSLLTLALAQAEAGEQLQILSCFEGDGEPLRLRPGLEVHSLFPRRSASMVQFGLRFRHHAVRWARARRDHFDVVHGHSGFADYLLVSSALRRALDLPTVHTMYCPIPLRGGRWRYPLVRQLINRSARQVDALTALSRNVARSLRSFGMGEVEVIAPPVDLERFRPAPDAAAARRELGLPPDCVAILFVGNAKPQKNMSGVLRAVAKLRARHANVRLIVTTELKQSSSDRDLSRLRREMVELGLESAVVQKGIVDDMPRLMQACDLLVAPFLDSFGPSDYFMAVLEAMACGKPTISSAVGGMPEVIADDAGGLVDPRDEAQLVAMLERYVADPGLRAATGRCARAYTERHFEPAQVAEQYAQVYARIAA